MNQERGALHNANGTQILHRVGNRECGWNLRPKDDEEDRLCRHLFHSFSSLQNLSFWYENRTRTRVD
jgi:hypothetical protein